MKRKRQKRTREEYTCKYCKVRTQFPYAAIFRGDGTVEIICKACGERKAHLPNR